MRVINVNLDEKKIDFALLDNFRKGMNLGKTAKQKAKKANANKPVFKEVKSFKKEKPKKKKQAVKSKKKVAKKAKK